MKIAIDIDEILCETVRPFLDFIEESKGIKKDFEEVFSYNLWDVFELEKKEVDKIFHEVFFGENLVCNLDLVDGAQRGIEILNEENELFFITSRPEYYLDKTKEFIIKNFVSEPQIYFSGDFCGNGKTKNEICEDLGIDLIIEDNGETSLKYAESGLNILLLDKPWNQDFEHDRIFRCFSWDDILDKIEELARTGVPPEDGKNEKLF